MEGNARSTSVRSRRRSPHGIAYVTEDRKSLGLILNEDIKNNVTLANLPGIAWRGVIDDRKEAKVADQYRAKLQHPLLRHPAEDAQPVGRQPAEGGAQQMAVRRSRRC